MNIGQWDTICTVQTSYVNQQLANNLDQILQEFSYGGDDPFAGPYTIRGTFGPWQVVPGGSNSLLHMQVPIKSGTLSPRSGSSTDISGMSVVVEISLALLPAPGSSSQHELRFDFREVGTQPGDTTPGLVTPFSVSDPNHTGKGSTVENAVVQCLVAHGSEVSFVFATVGVVDPGAQSWLSPTASTYNYTNPVGGGEGFLSILSATQGQDISGWDAQIDSALLSTEYPITFAVSQPLFLQNVVMPLLPRSFPGTDASTFAYRAGTGIVSTRGFGTPGVQKGAITYYPEVTSLVVSASDNHLSTSAQGTCDLDVPNAYMGFSVSASNVLQYDAGANTLHFQPDPNPTTSHDNHIPWYDYVLIALTGGIALAIFAIVVPIIANEIADDLNSAGTLDLSQTPPQTVMWQGMEALQVQDAGLSDLFYLRGSPVPAGVLAAV